MSEKPQARITFRVGQTALDATVDSGVVIVPSSEGEYRAYTAGQPHQLGDMLAAFIVGILRQPGGAHIISYALRVVPTIHQASEKPLG